MNSSDLVMAGSYNYDLVAHSILIAMLGSWATINLAGRVTAARGDARLAWRIGGASWFILRYPVMLLQILDKKARRF